MVSINKRAATKTVVIAVALAALAVIALGGYRWFKAATTNTYTAFFPVAASLYKGDPVRVLGVNVGTVDSITPRKGDVGRAARRQGRRHPRRREGGDRRPEPGDGPIVQLTPVFSSGEKLANNATIPMERTAVPMEGRHQGAAEQTQRVARPGDRWQQRHRRQGRGRRGRRRAEPESDGNGEAIRRRSPRCPT